MKLFRLLSISIAITAMLCSSCSSNDEETIPTSIPNDEETIPTSFLNSQTFPDANFRAYIAERTGIPEGEAIPAEVIASITSIDVQEKNIASLKGIEIFTELTRLICYSNQLTQLDVSNNTELTSLLCTNNQLTQLDVSNNTKLTSLLCTNNQLTQLDVSNNTELTWLLCSQNIHLSKQSLPGGKYGIRLSDETDATRVQDLQVNGQSAPCNMEEHEGHKYLIISHETSQVTYNYECDSTRKMDVTIYVDD